MRAHPHVCDDSRADSDRVRAHIIEKILTLCCPRCKQVREGCDSAPARLHHLPLC